MKRMFLLFSHTLSDEQAVDARERLRVDEIVYLPQELQALWGGFDPSLERVDTEEFERFLSKEANIDDIVLIQGDFGASFKMVQFALENKLIPVYATTKREVMELVEDGEKIKKSIFKHVRFRKYGV